MEKPLRHIVSVDDIPPEDLLTIFRRADHFKAEGIWEPPVKKRRLKLLNLFYQPSTRTRLSFASAAFDLGWNVMDTEDAEKFSSAIKGESLGDTVRVVSGYCDVITLRHHKTGSAAEAALVSRVPIINAGDGHGEHPTQAFLDLFTIRERHPEHHHRLTVTFVGDLKRGRTVHSLARLLVRFQSNELGLARRLQFVAPNGYELPQEILDGIKGRGVEISIHDELSPKVLRGSNVVYMTRPQFQSHESIESGRALARTYTLTPALVEHLPENATILHPLPRTDELPESLDNDGRAYYFQQAWNGVPLRSALLQWVAGII